MNLHPDRILSENCGFGFGSLKEMSSRQGGVEPDPTFEKKTASGRQEKAGSEWIPTTLSLFTLDPGVIPDSTFDKPDPAVKKKADPG